METAKEIIHESLPIKCLEAVILAVYPFDKEKNVIAFLLLVQPKKAYLFLLSVRDFTQNLSYFLT